VNKSDFYLRGVNMDKNTVSGQDTNQMRRPQPPMSKNAQNPRLENQDLAARRKEDGPVPEFGRAVETDEGTIEDVPEEAAP
jgi:hypothetical protein